MIPVRFSGEAGYRVGVFSSLTTLDVHTSPRSRERERDRARLSLAEDIPILAEQPLVL